MVLKGTSAEPTSPTTPNSGSNKVTIKHTPTEIPDVTSHDIDRVMKHAEEIASSLQSDTSRAKSWITNAKLALDVANRSLDEASKLAHNVEMTAEDTANKMKTVDIGSIDFEGKEGDDIVDKGSRLVKAAEKEAIPGSNQSSQDLFGPDEVVKLQLRALQIQSLVKETREQVNEARASIAGKTTMMALGMKDQAANLTDNLEVATHVIEERRHNRDSSSPPVDAEAILKGETPDIVDPSSLDKIDGVFTMRKTSSMDTTAAQASATPSSVSTISSGTWLTKNSKESNIPEETNLGAEDLLKVKGAVKADPASMDKIDGLPVRTHNSESLAGVEHTFPHL